MSETIKVRFRTRREADLALEHLVQEYAVDRADIFISAAGNDNSAGSEPAGADVESGHPNERAEGEPALAGDIELSVDVNDARAPSLRQALAELGASDRD